MNGQPTEAKIEALKTWLANWASAQPLSDMTVREMVERCRADAMLHGIKAFELEEAVGDLGRYLDPSTS